MGRQGPRWCRTTPGQRTGVPAREALRALGLRPPSFAAARVTRQSMRRPIAAWIVASRVAGRRSPEHAERVRRPLRKCAWRMVRGG